MASCATPRTPPFQIEEPVFGDSGATTFFISTPQDSVRAQDLAHIARVLRYYKTLDRAERTLVRLAVSSRLQAIVGLEVQRVALEHSTERAKLSGMPDKVVAAKELKTFDAAIRAEAVARVTQRFGRWIAVPLKISTNRTPVAFARINGAAIEVEEESDEVDVSAASLREGRAIRKRTGEIATLLETVPVPIAAPPR